MSKIRKHFLKIYIIKYTLGYGIRFSKVWKAIRISSMGLISVMGTVKLTVPLKTVKKQRCRTNTTKIMDTELQTIVKNNKSMSCIPTSKNLEEFILSFESSITIHSHLLIFSNKIDFIRGLNDIGAEK